MLWREARDIDDKLTKYDKTFKLNKLNKNNYKEEKIYYENKIFSTISDFIGNGNFTTLYNSTFIIWNETRFSIGDDVFMYNYN